VSKTVAIYQQTESGMLRVDTFRPLKHYSILAVSEQSLDRHPNFDPGQLFIARRIKIAGGR
jgi:hypothetical protein